MTTQAVVNPYVAPRAAVADAQDEFQPVRIFSTSGRIGRVRYILYTMVVPFIIMFCAGLVSAFAGPAGVVVTHRARLLPGARAAAPRRGAGSRARCRA